MEKKRGTTIIVVAALIIAIVSLGVALAAFSTTLTINGTATVQASSWNVFFATAADGTDPGSTTGVPLPNGNIAISNLQTGVTPTATASATVKSADFTWSATFKTPGDKVVYDFYVRNTGTYNAKITSINAPTKTCTKGGQTETTVCPHIHYGIYNDAAGTDAVAVDDVLNATSNAHYYVIAWMDNDNWDPEGSDLPDANVTVDYTQVSIIYTQAD